MYTTTSKVRELSGFDDVTLIPDSIVSGKISAAEGMFDSACASIYTLPFTYRIQNTLTFSGVGVGGDTMTITINGTGYDIAITADLTASEAADLFRISAIGSADFKVVDSIGGGEVVTIVSLTTSSSLTTALAEVNITDASTTEGVSGTIGTRENRYAPIIDQITAEMAAALLLIDNYGIEAQDTPKDGRTRIDMINETLQKIQQVHESGQVIKLFDEITKEELAISASGSSGFLPNVTTNNDTDDPTSAKIGINKVF